MIATQSYTSGLARQFEDFVRHREASGRWCVNYEEGLRLFDRHCASTDPSSATLTQGMVDGWFRQRDTETPASCYKRTAPARAFVRFARERGLTEAAPPDPRHPGDPVPVPHAFTVDELSRFFAACDAITVQGKNKFACTLRKIACPAFFRLLYSSGMRTTEARLLGREEVDLAEGVLDIRRSKGRDQHYVALHESMVAILRDYDAAADRLQPGREWFFQSPRGGHYRRAWVNYNFRKLWTQANGDPAGVTAYMLRHNYATTNIMSWDGTPHEEDEMLLYLSKSMGHRDVSSTLRYFSIVPALADKMLELTEGSFNETVPEVWDD